MKPDKAARDAITRGTILQLNPESKDFAKPGALCIVDTVESWGVRAYVAGEGVIRIAWSHLEPTGGRARWDWEGKDLPQMEQPLRHHP